MMNSFTLSIAVFLIQLRSDQVGTMSATGYPRKVYKEDGEGNAFCVQQTTFGGKTIHYPPTFPDASYVLENISSMKLRESDIWLITYPKSGTHWVYEIVSILVSGKLEPPRISMKDRLIELKTTFERTEDDTVPSIHLAHMLKEYLPNKVFEQGKIVYVIRNPKSVASSHFSQRRRMEAYEYMGTFSGFLSTFLNDPHTCMGTWFEHVTQYWKALKKTPNVLFVCFEDLVKDPLKTVQEISTFLGCDHSKQFCEAVVKLTSLESMKATEKQRRDAYSNQFWKDGQSGFIQKGKIDGWKTFFTVAENERFDSVYEREMKDFQDLKEMIKFE